MGRMPGHKRRETQVMAHNDILSKHYSLLWEESHWRPAVKSMDWKSKDHELDHQSLVYISHSQSSKYERSSRALHMKFLPGNAPTGHAWGLWHALQVREIGKPLYTRPRHHL